MKLRDYQEQAIEISNSAYHAGNISQLIELPTGTGKTIIFGELAKQHYNRGRVLFITHRQEIVRQAAKAIAEHIGRPTGIVMGKDDQYGYPIVVSNIATIARPSRLQRVVSESPYYQPIRTILIDECHHYKSDGQYDRVIHSVQQSCPDALIIGASATPYRNDKTNILDYFKPVFARTIERMEREGWLAPTIWQRFEIDANFDKVPVKVNTDGDRDFALPQLASEISRNLGYIAEQTASIIGSRQTLMFACNLDQMHELTELLRIQGVNTESVWGDMPTEDRASVLARWSKEATQVVVNVGVLTEGFDYTEISAIVLARPTMSPGLYVQMIGRGLRTNEAKENCLIVDFVGHPPFRDGIPVTKQITLADIKGTMATDGQDNTKYERNHKRILRMFRQWSSIPFAYIDDLDSYVISVPSPNSTGAKQEYWEFAIVNDPVSGLYIPGQIHKKQFIRSKIECASLRTLISKLDTRLNEYSIHPYHLNDRYWSRGLSPSEKQLSLLYKISADYGINSYEKAIDEEWTKGDVTQEITRLFAINPIRKFLGMPRLGKSNVMNRADLKAIQQSPSLSLHQLQEMGNIFSSRKVAIPKSAKTNPPPIIAENLEWIEHTPPATPEYPPTQE